MSDQNRILRWALIAVALVAVGVVVVILLRACGGEEAAADPLAGTKWQVRSYYNPTEIGGMASPVGGTQMTAEFTGAEEPENRIVSGSAGCNSYTAGYTVDGESLTIGRPAATMMFCEQPAGVMDQEAAFLAAMQSASSYKLETEQLHILNEKGNVVVDFVPLAASPDTTPPPVNPTLPPSEGTAEPGAVDTSWDDIQAVGKIVAGTSAD